jgi:hypothetical protein
VIKVLYPELAPGTCFALSRAECCCTAGKSTLPSGTFCAFTCTVAVRTMAASRACQTLCMPPWHACVQTCNSKPDMQPDGAPSVSGRHSLTSNCCVSISRRLAAEEAAACRLAMRNRTLSILTAGGGFPQLTEICCCGRPPKNIDSFSAPCNALTPDGA